MLSVSSAALLFVACVTPASAQQVRINAESIGGVVTGANGPEAGVWVIAETRDLPTKYVKIVVTDDQGRYVLPDLPKGNYDIWVRGYGLVDSPKTKSAPGKQLNLKAVAAPNRAAAAQYYPAIYWYSMVKVPDKALFPGTGPAGNGMSQAMPDQALWLRYMKTDGCISCHQLGDKATRTIPSSSAISIPAARHGSGASNPARPARTWSTPSAASTRNARSPISAIGPTASRRANCPRPIRRGPPAESAISS
jgi:hypothetical protein